MLWVVIGGAFAMCFHWSPQHDFVGRLGRYLYFEGYTHKRFFSVGARVVGSHWGHLGEAFTVCASCLVSSWRNIHLFGGVSG